MNFALLRLEASKIAAELMLTIVPTKDHSCRNATIGSTFIARRASL